MKKGQVSLEYLIVVGFVMTIVISFMGVAYIYASSIQDRIKINQLERFANKLISSAESVHFAGEPSKVTITAYLPKGVTDIKIIENSIVFDITLDSGLNKLSFPSTVPLNPNIEISTSEGLKRFEIFAESNPFQVSIVEN